MVLMNSDLVVIIDAEGRKNFEDIGKIWFPSARAIDDQEYLIETPLGDERTVVGTLVEEPRLGQASEEFLYLETTLGCNFRCNHCGVVDDLEKAGGNSRYITPLFARKLGKAIRKNNRMDGRSLVFGGGEPLISIEDFDLLSHCLGEPERTQKIVSTNGYNLPLDQEQFNLMMEDIGHPAILLSCADGHRGFYERLASAGGHEHSVPGNVSSKEALFEKARIIKEYCSQLGVGFKLNVVEKDHEVSGDLRKFVLRRAKEMGYLGITDSDFFCTKVDVDPSPCAQGQELAIRADGRLYTSCYDIFNGGKNRLGVVGTLKQERING